MGAPEPVELSWSVEPEALLSAVGADNPVVGAMVRLSDPHRRSTASLPGSLMFLAVFAAAAVYFAVRSDGSAALVACALLACAALLSFVPHRRSAAPDRDRLLREPIQLQLRLDEKGATVVANGSARTHFWPEVTRIRSTSAGLTVTSRVGQFEDLTLVPASAMTPDSLRQTKELVDAYAPGRWYDG